MNTNNFEQDAFMIKHRKRTSKKQLEVLEKTFETCIRPDSKLRKKLGDQLNMTPRAVQIWFQNRRAKIKKITGEYKIKKKIDKKTVTNDFRNYNMDNNENLSNSPLYNNVYPYYNQYNDNTLFYKDNFYNNNVYNNIENVNFKENNLYKENNFKDVNYKDGINYNDNNLYKENINYKENLYKDNLYKEANYIDNNVYANMENNMYNSIDKSPYPVCEPMYYNKHQVDYPYNHYNYNNVHNGRYPNDVYYGGQMYDKTQFYNNEQGYPPQYDAYYYYDETNQENGKQEE